MRSAIVCGVTVSPLPGGVYYDRPGVAFVNWDTISHAVHMEWQGWANSAEYREANDAIVTALMANRSSKLLGDSRNLKVIKKSDQDWSNQDWFPRVLAAGLKRMALVIPQSGLAKMNVDEILSKVPGTPLEVAYFATLDEARGWLATPRATPPVLQTPR